MTQQDLFSRPAVVCAVDPMLDPAYFTLAREINAALDAGRRHGKESLASFLVAGRKLLKAKEGCKHGAWKGWLTANFDLDESQARRYMQVAKDWLEIETYAKRERAHVLSIRDALRILKDINRAKRANAPPRRSRKKKDGATTTTTATSSDTSPAAEQKTQQEAEEQREAEGQRETEEESEQDTTAGNGSDEDVTADDKMTPIREAFLNALKSLPRKEQVRAGDLLITWGQMAISGHYSVCHHENS